MLSQYRGKSIEDIKEDKGIKEEEKRKVIPLLKLGVSIPKEKGNILKVKKQKRDEAKAKNDEAKKLEAEVSEELKKRGHIHEEQ